MDAQTGGRAHGQDKNLMPSPTISRRRHYGFVLSMRKTTGATLAVDNAASEQLTTQNGRQ